MLRAACGDRDEAAASCACAQRALRILKIRGGAWGWVGRWVGEGGPRQKFLFEEVRFWGSGGGV